MATEIFNRQELKFIILKDTYASLMPTILKYMQLDVHNLNSQTYRLYNLYVDTVDHSLIRHSMAKPVVYKEKIRIRSYSPLTPTSMVFLEVKKRYKKITNKRRTKIIMNDALNFIETGTPPPLHNYMNPQVMNELTAILHAQQYRPTAYISYSRVAFHTIHQADDLRITFDSDISSQEYGQNATHCLLSDKYLIMEIKSLHNMPMWLVKLLDSHGIYKQSFSKYGTEYMRTLKEDSRLHYA